MNEKRRRKLLNKMMRRKPAWSARTQAQFKKHPMLARLHAAGAHVADTGLSGQHRCARIQHRLLGRTIMLLPKAGNKKNLPRIERNKPNADYLKTIKFYNGATSVWSGF